MYTLIGIGAILVGLFIVGFFLFRTFFNVVENFRLITGGTVTQGIVSEEGFCGKTSSRPLYVQFTDTQGKREEAAANDCGIDRPFRHEGDHVSIVYVRDTPSIARIQDDLVVQSVLEVLFLLITLWVIVDIRKHPERYHRRKVT